jgi:hypothetical protein
MFVRQAGRQFELFTGESPPLEYMTETLRRAMSAARMVVAPESEKTEDDESESDD